MVCWMCTVSVNSLYFTSTVHCRISPFPFRYTLLVGKPPFETQSLKDTYARIRRNEYHIPPKVSESAKIFIRRLLRLNPSERPTMSEVLCDPFFSAGYMPLRLPTSCLSMAPHFKKAPSIAPAPKGEGM